MVQIIPAILESDWIEVENKLNLTKEFATWVQLDIMDGIFVPEKSWANPTDLKNYFEVQPPSKQLNIEVDLMVKNPENIVEAWIEAGAKRVIIHIESTDKVRKAIDIVKKAGVEVGIALNIDTTNKVLDEFMADTDFVQFMGIEKIGFQGQPFGEKVLHKVIDLRTRYSNAIISIDGGVNMKTVPLLVKAGVSRLVAGSAVFTHQSGARAGWEELGDLAVN